MGHKGCGYERLTEFVENAFDSDFFLEMEWTIEERVTFST